MKYIHILNRIYNKPLAISEDKLQIISSNVGLKLLQGDIMPMEGFEPTSKEVSSEDIPIIKVFDSLVAKNGAGLSGYTSYEGLNRQIKEAMIKKPTKMGFYIDSPGGEVDGLFNLSNTIHGLHKQGVKTFAFTDGSMTSAAYAIGSATDKVYAVDGSTIGSIGVVMDAIDLTKVDEEIGVKHTILRSKENKQSYNPHEVLTEEKLTKLKSMLSEYDNIFNETVSTYRPQLTIDAIIDMKGDVFTGKSALKLNLVDEVVGSFDEVLIKESATPKSTSRGIQMNETEFKELQAELEKVKAKATLAEAEFSTRFSAAITQETERCLSILESANTLKLSQATAMKRIKAGTTAEDAVEIFTAIAEERDDSKVINTSGLTATLSEAIEGKKKDPDEVKIEFGGENISIKEILNQAKAGVK